MKRRGDARGGGPTILLHTRREVSAELLRLPMLLLDATMPVDIVKHYLPRLAVLGDVRAQAPHMAVRQIRGGWRAERRSSDKQR